MAHAPWTVAGTMVREAGGVAKATFLAAIWLIADSSQVAPCPTVSLVASIPFGNAI